MAASYKTMGNYKIDVKNKIILADTEKLTDKELHIISMYIAAGYVIKEKKTGLSYDDMRKKVKADKELSEELEKKIKAKENYMQVKKWFKANTK